MAETNSPNPSEPDPQDNSGQQDPDKPPVEKIEETPRQESKLKLKKILTPISPHLTAPRPLKDERLEKGPEVDKGPAPRAIPAEIEAEAPPPEPEAKAPSGPGFDEPLPDEGEGPAASTEADNEDSPAEPEEESAEEAAPEPEEAAPEPVKKGGLRRISRILAPVLLVAALAMTANFIFDPFGLKENPVQPTAPKAPVQTASEPEIAPASSEATGAELGHELTAVTIESYLDQLKVQQVHLVRNPDGLYIDGAFVPTGASLNPILGLRLKAISDSEAVIEDSGLREYRIPVF